MLSYDIAHHQWLNVPPNWVSRDGGQFAYTAGIYAGGTPPPNAGPPILPQGSRIHVVDLATGTDRVVYTSSSIVFNVLDFSPQRIYLTAPCLAGCTSDANKLWRLDLDTGHLQKLSDIQTGWVVSAEAAWGTNAANTSVIRFDPRDSSVSIWFSSPTGPSVRGLDAEGHPIVAINNDHQVLIVVSPNTTDAIYSGDGFIGQPFADSRGVWFSNNQQGIFLYAKPMGLQKMSAVTGIVAGPCD